MLVTTLEVSTSICIPLDADHHAELALLNRQARAATVRASTKLRVVALGEQAFTRLLGPAKDIMARNVNERYGGYNVGRE